MPVRLEHQGLCVRSHMWDKLGPRAASFRLQPGPDKRLCAHSGVLLAHTTLCGALGCATDPSRLESFTRAKATYVVYTDPMQRATDSIGPQCLTSHHVNQHPCARPVHHLSDLRSPSPSSASTLCLIILQKCITVYKDVRSSCSLCLTILQKCITVHRAHHKHVHVVLS